MTSNVEKRGLSEPKAATASPKREDVEAAVERAVKAQTDHEFYRSVPILHVDLRTILASLSRPKGEAGAGVALLHTAIMDAIHGELMRQNPGSFTEEDGNSTIAIPVSKPFLTLNVSEMAEVVLPVLAALRPVSAVPGVA